MGQEDVLNYLQKQEKPKSRTEIANALNDNPTKISLTIRRLLEHEEIKCIEINKEQAKVMYKCHRRMRLYYC